MFGALEDLDSKRRGLAAGADEFLSKPVNVLELQMRVSSMLRIRRLTNELEDANRQLQTLATIDPLTKLMNRRVLDARLDQEFARAARLSAPSRVHDARRRSFQEGQRHPRAPRGRPSPGAGWCADHRDHPQDRRCRALWRGGVCCRGPESSRTGALVLAEELRHAVASGGRDSSDLPRVTVSVGIATTELGVASAQDLLRRADEALYEAKEAGRNRIVVAR